jgi:outer membrane protein insertion porin family
MTKIKKIFITFFLFLSLADTNSNAEIATTIDIQGNERISNETIIVYGDITKDKDYTASDINNLIKKLYDTSFFSNISVNLKNGILKIVVEENPIINSIVLGGENADKYKEAIIELLILREKTSFLKANVKSDINLIKEFYRQLGYYFVNIDLDVEKLTKNRVNLKYTIDKGNKAKIAKIFFLGDKKIRDTRLRNVITSQEAKFWKFISRNVYLNQQRVNLDKRLLKNYYKNKGYYEVDITSSNIEYSEGDGFILTYSINAGQKYKFKKIYVDVAKELDASAFDSLENEFTKIIGDDYSQRKVRLILEKIDQLSEYKELQFVNHRLVETLDGDGIEIKIEIYEGQKFTVERIDILGNSVTNDEVIRGTMIIDEGDPYSALLINKSINKLKARNIFGKVESEIKEGSSPDLKVLEVRLEEKATGEIMAGAGVGTAGTSFMASVSENNWLGRGITLESTLNISEEKLSGAISLINPNYNYSDNSVFGSLSLASSDLTSTSGYKSSHTGISLGTEFEQYENLYLSPSLSISNESIETDSTASSQLKKMDGTFTNLDFTYSVTVDKRNQPFQPTAGYRSKFLQTLPIIQDSSSIINGYELSSYKGFSDNFTGAVKLYARAIHGVDKDVRITNRLFLPAKKLRGFDTRKVGPKDGDDWVGGNYTTALSFEALLPNLLPEDTKTDISLFLDSGNVWEVDYSNTIEDSNKIRSAFGVSANVFTPVGPLTFTLAQDISKSSTDNTEAFNFRLGTSF